MNRTLRQLFCMFFFYACASAWAETRVRLTNLPHAYIETFTGRSITSKSNYVLGRMWYVDEEDKVVFYDSLEIRVRGNSTANLAKKPYKLKFHEKVKWLGKGHPNTKKWTLLANHGDKALIRNAVTSKIGEFLGLKFNPAARFIDLTVNGEYVGNYQISDQVDVRPHRVNVAEQDVPLTDESNITGGYLLEADGFKGFENGRTGFYSARKNVPICIHYPDDDEIQNQQYRYIHSFVNDFEQRLYSNTFDDPIEGYRSRVDSTSLANWYIASEVSGNPDAFWSTYFYKHQDDDKLYWGPLWDYDIAYGNDNRIGDTSYKMMKDVGFGSNVLRPWIIRIWEDAWFARLINRRYSEAVHHGLEQFLLEKVDSLADLLQESQQLNYQRWGINVRTLRECVLYSTYDQYINDLRRYISNHIPYLETAFASLLPDEPEPDPDPEPDPEPEPEPDPDLPKVPDFAANTEVYYTITNTGTGTVFDLNPEDDRICANQYDSEAQSQQWRIIPLKNGYMHIVNRMTGQALNDPTPGQPTANTEVGTQLTISVADSTDQRQQWDIVTQPDGRWNLINHFSQHAANLSGGNKADGASIISYTSDDRNGNSKNRMWIITPVAEVVDGIEDMNHSDFDYALAYDPTGQRLHIGSDALSELRFTVHLYDRSGRLLRSFLATEECNIASLPRGLYIVSWSYQGRQHSVKFMKK